MDSASFRIERLTSIRTASADGLPIGMHLVAGAGQEALLLALAAQLEEALPWSGRRPPAYAG